MHFVKLFLILTTISCFKLDRNFFGSLHRHQPKLIKTNHHRAFKGNCHTFSGFSGPHYSLLVYNNFTWIVYMIELRIIDRLRGVNWLSHLRVRNYERFYFDTCVLRPPGVFTTLFNFDDFGIIRTRILSSTIWCFFRYQIIFLWDLDLRSSDPRSPVWVEIQKNKLQI